MGAHVFSKCTEYFMISKGGQNNRTQLVN